MVLSQTQIVDLIKAPKNTVLSDNIKLQDDHKVHIQGYGFESVLHRIIGYENVEQFKQKKLLTKPFTRPIFKKIINSQSRWKTALGTTKYYKFSKNSDKLSIEFSKDVLSQIWKGGSIDVLINKFQHKAIYEEFNGYYIVETPAKKEVDGKTYIVRDGIEYESSGSEKLKPYVVFKSASEVYNFKQNGNRVEFIVFDYGKIKRNGFDIQLYRVIDDKYDYIVEKTADGIIKISTDPNYKTIEHKAGQCPVVCITNINKCLTNDQTRTSPVDDIICLLDYYLHQFAEHLVTEILHAHPNFYQVGTKCMERSADGLGKCEGGRIQYQKDGKDFDYECGSCKGTGHNLHKDASTTIILPAKDAEGNAFSITNVAGYVAPPIDALKYQEAAIDWMENKILDAALGLNNVSTTDKLERTATETMVNLKPLEDIISEIIDIIEGVEINITNIVGKMYYGDRYKGCEVIYGRRLSLRDENVLLKELKESKSAGTSYNHLKALNEELTYRRFIRSEYDLQRSVILNELEPLIGFTFDEIEKSANIPDETKKLKQNFVDYIQRFELENGSVVDYKPEMELPKKIADIKAVLLSYIPVVEAEKVEPPTLDPPIDTLTS